MTDIFTIPDKGAFTIECARSVTRLTPTRFDSFEAAKQFADENLTADLYIVCHGQKMNHGDASTKTTFHVDAQRIKGEWTMANE